MKLGHRRWLIRIGVVLLIIGSAVAGVVVPRYVPLGSGFDACGSLSDATRVESCIANAGRRYLKAHDLQALARTVDDMSQQSWFYANCHQAMHTVVTPFGTRIGQRGEQLHGVGGSSTCALGIAHGLMIGYLSSATSTGLRAFAIDSCPARASGEINYETCVHAVGHAAFRKRIPFTDASAVCSRLATAVGAQRDTPVTRGSFQQRAYVECVGGVMMERTFAKRSAASTCPRIGTAAPQQAFTDACVSYLPINMAHANYSSKAIARACLRQSRTQAVLAFCASTYASVIARASECAYVGKAAAICSSARQLNSSVKS